MKLFIVLMLAMLTCSGCMGGGAIVGAVAPHFEPVGRWVLGSVLRLEVSQKLDSKRPDEEYLVKQYVDNRLREVAPHADIAEGLLQGVFSRKNGGLSLFVLKPMTLNRATLTIYGDTTVRIYLVERDLPPDQEELLMEQQDVSDRADKILEKLQRAKKARPPDE